MRPVRGGQPSFFVFRWRWHLDDDHLSYLGEDLYHFSHMYTPMGIHCTPRVLGCDSRYGDVWMLRIRELSYMDTRVLTKSDALCTPCLPICPFHP